MSKKSQNFKSKKAVSQSDSSFFKVKTISKLHIGDNILDIRPLDEQDKHPLLIDNVNVISFPFYKLESKFDTLDQSKSYLIYCDHGVMSRLQALYLYEKGFCNIKVYLPREGLHAQT